MRMHRTSIVVISIVHRMDGRRVPAKDRSEGFRGQVERCFDGFATRPRLCAVVTSAM
jgi:hypothetical protein